MKKAIKLTAVLLTLVMVMGVAVSCDIPFIDELGNLTGLNDLIGMITGDENVLVGGTQNFEVYSGAAKCFFMNNFNSFGQVYLSYSVSVVTLDPNMPLDDQYITAGSPEHLLLGYEGSWLTYFVNQTMDDIHETLALCEYALAHGIVSEVTDEAVTNTMASLASKYSSVDHIGSVIDEDDVRDYLSLVTLADAARNYISENISNSLTEYELQNYIKENEDVYECLDVIKYEFFVYRQDFENEEAFKEHLDKMRAHMEEVCAAEDAQEFVRIMDGKSDDVADYIKKGYTRKDMDVKASDVLFGGEIGTTVYSETESVLGNGNKRVAFTAYMRHSDTYLSRTRNYYYALFSDEAQATEFINALKGLSSYDFDKFRGMAQEMGASEVEYRENQMKSSVSLKDKVFYEYNFSTDIVAPEVEVNGGAKVEYYAGAKVGNTASYDTSVSVENESGKLSYDYSYSTDIGGTTLKPEYSIVAPGGASAIVPGGSYVTIVGGNGTLVASGIDNWVFDESRQVGDVTETPVLVGGGRAVLVYTGEGEYCHVIEARTKLAEEKTQEEVNKAKSKVSIYFEAEFDSLFAKPKSSSGFLPF